MGKTANLTSFNLIDYAKQHRYRLRNLHDGHPCPPARAPRVGERGREVAFRADDDREMAIVGSRGYVTAEGDGLGFMLTFKSGHGKTKVMRALERAGDCHRGCYSVWDGGGRRLFWGLDGRLPTGGRSPFSAYPCLRRHATSQEMGTVPTACFSSRSSCSSALMRVCRL